MTIEPLEQRISELERQVATLQREVRPLASVHDTFGMFANDPEFDEIARLGRKYRDEVNSEDD